MESEEVLTPEQQELERLYLLLRTNEGVSQSDYPTIGASGALSRGWVELHDARVRCTAEGWLRLDALVHALTRPTAIS